MATDFGKPEFFVESDSSGIPFPNAEPNHIGFSLDHFIEAHRHQILSNAPRMPRLCDINSLNLTWILCSYTARCFGPPKLSKCNQIAAIFANQRSHSWVCYLAQLNTLGITRFTMKIHVFNRVHSSEGVTEGLLSQCSQILCISRNCVSNRGHGWIPERPTQYMALLRSTCTAQS